MNLKKDIIEEFKDKLVVVVGMARSGVGAANLLHRLGSIVIVNDIKPASELTQFTSHLHPEIRQVFGNHPTELFDNVHMIVVSPGVPLTLPPLQKAIDKGIKVIGEVELAYYVFKSIGNPDFYAITGSNGKSTTTTLLYEILRQSGKSVFIGGNIGNALTEAILQFSPFSNNRCPDFIVAELSSFQLETIITFKPSAATILNISSDHQDRYHAMQPYVDAKCNIFKNQNNDDIFILNADDMWTPYIASKAMSVKKLYFSRHLTNTDAYFKDGYIYAVNGDFKLDVSKMTLQGVHNIENAMAAILMALHAGCSYEAVEKAVCTFKGLAHRLEFVKELNGVKFINDSKGTNTAAVVKSLEGFQSPVILIAGGRDKDSDFTELIPQIKRCVKAVVLIGESADKIARAINNTTNIIFANSLFDAVCKAYATAQAGDTVLLSPACASFDMFRDFEDRGNQFKEIVKSL